MGRLQGRLALITGASRGIGRAIACAYAAEGAHVILVARTVGALEEVDDAIRPGGGAATLVPLDLKDFPAIDRLGASIHERWGKLDILVGNAGMLGTLSPLAHQKPETWQELLDINLTANWRLIRAMDPLLRLSDAGRALFVTSTVGHDARAYWGGYAVSKAALEAMVMVYAAECAKSALHVNLINPGATRTRMRAQAMPGEDPQTVPLPETVAPLFVDLACPTSTVHGRRIDAWTWHAGG